MSLNFAEKNENSRRKYVQKRSRPTFPLDCGHMTIKQSKPLDMNAPFPQGIIFIFPTAAFGEEGVEKYFSRRI